MKPKRAQDITNVHIKNNFNIKSKQKIYWHLEKKIVLDAQNKAMLFLGRYRIKVEWLKKKGNLILEQSNILQLIKVYCGYSLQMSLKSITQINNLFSLLFRNNFSLQKYVIVWGLSVIYFYLKYVWLFIFFPSCSSSGVM